MKKEYLKPDAEYINFYSIEETNTTEVTGSINGEWGEEEIPWN